MQRFSSIFSQLLQLFSRLQFESAVREHQAEYATKGFCSWGQFIALLFCQLGRAHSLREICDGLAGCEGKLKHLGVKEPPKRSTLSYANKHRPWELYRTIFLQLLAKCQSVVCGKSGGKKKFTFKNKLVSLDSSTITLSLSLYNWAHYQRAKGAVKSHMLLDHDGYLPKYAIITDGKKGDSLIGKMFEFEKGTVLVMDRGYNDYDWYAQLSKQGVFFVTRLKDNAVFTEVTQEARQAEGDKILLDRVITFDKHKADENGEKPKFRIVKAWIDGEHGIFTFLTNNMEFDAKTIAAIYKDRWSIEAFFKAIKQNLKIKTFLGTSENAVKTQIWTALIAMLILRYLQLLSTVKWSLSNLVAMLRQQLFVYRDLLAWLNKPREGPPQLAEIKQLSFDLSFSTF
jgi:hypothetical protein